jgi:hypothetical protein
MRLVEWINLAFFTSMMAGAILRPLEPRRRKRAVAWGVAGTGIVMFCYFFADQSWMPGLSVIRDWAPAPLLLMAYWQAGQLAQKASPRLQNMLVSLDRVWRRGPQPPQNGLRASGVESYLELTYLTCYALVPLAYGFCYFRDAGGCADVFWSTVVPPTYLCYALVPFLPHFPPRMLSDERWIDASASAWRRRNLWLLDRGSIGFNTFPSAHVASTMAASLILWHHQPGVGFWFLLVAGSIAVGAVVRRYHYVLDSLAGVALAVLSLCLNIYVSD